MSILTDCRWENEGAPWSRASLRSFLRCCSLRLRGVAVMYRVRPYSCCCSRMRYYCGDLVYLTRLADVAVAGGVDVQQLRLLPMYYVAGLHIFSICRRHNWLLCLDTFLNRSRPLSKHWGPGRRCMLHWLVQLWTTHIRTQLTRPNLDMYFGPMQTSALPSGLISNSEMDKNTQG